MIKAIMKQKGLLLATATPLAFALAAPAFAQDAVGQPQTNQDAAATNPPMKDIVVTGSRIARPQVEASVPVAVISAQSIQNVGQTNVLDALRDLPIAGQSADRSASNFQNSGNGTATVNLRNLGPSRTLVLINGRRSVGEPGSSAVDLNNIPVDLIDHVEVVTGGASAVYGSDAVAGVVNIILKNDFSGLNVHLQNMISSRGDGESPLISVLAGHDFAGGAGHITANVTYTNSDAIPSANRAYSRNDSPTGSAYTPQGAFFDAAGDGFTFDPNNNVIPYTGAASQRYNRASQRLLAVPVERYSASLIARYDFSPAVQLYGEFTYNKTKADAHIEPLAVDDLGTQGQSVINFDGSAFAGIPTSNPYVPAAIAAAAGPNSYLDFFKRSNGLFDRSPHDDRDYFRGVIGLKGEIATGWNYDLSYEHSQVRDETTNQSILMTNYGASLQATTIGGQIVCADPVARAAGCVPINPFGHQTYTAAQLKWLSTYTGQGVIIPGATPGQQVSAQFLQKNYQDVVSLAVTGSLFQLPNGPLGVAFGGEYHREKVSEIFDPFTQSVYSSQQLNGNEIGKYDSKEAFVEINAPIFGHHPGVYEFSLEGAARYSDYSTVGGVWTYKYGGTYAPTPDIRFRAIYARAVRAPNLNELFSPKANTAQQVVDPCDQAQGLGGAALVALPAGCSAIPGIASYLTTHPNFTYSLQQVQTIFGFTGGNPNLQAEATNTFTAGATLTPRFFHNFVLTADYYSIKVKNAVSSIDPQTSVTQCFETGSSDFCGLVHRNANGFITEVDEIAINAASYQVSGIDVQALYDFKTHFFKAENEKVSLDLYYNHKFKQAQTPFAGGPVSNELGTADTYASQQLGTGFKDQFTFNLNYTAGPASIHYRLKYLGPVKAYFGATVIPISAYTYSDLQVKFDLAKRFEFYVGANNLLDKQPPFIIGGNSQWPGTNTVADTYDLFGRMIYAGFTAKF
ncbi:MAG: TonB-dependent receptor [Candidatus Sphingomonas colombiensis]|nr:TonB-dependent receptor [Sphingomonas sp.]WEK42236.1 MAG: TonB-dependent receptor [Sphingomonas sp.]